MRIFQSEKQVILAWVYHPQVAHSSMSPYTVVPLKPTQREGDFRPLQL